LDLNFTAEELAFAARCAVFVEQALPQDIRASVLGGEHVEAGHIARWQKILHARAGRIDLATRVGRPGLDPIRQHIFDEECMIAGAAAASCRSACAWSARC